MCWLAGKGDSQDKVLEMFGVQSHCALCGWFGRNTTEEHLKI